MKIIRINDLGNAEKLLYEHNRKIGRKLSDDELIVGVRKFIKNGEVLGIVENDHIIAMINLYCNNYETLSAYLCNVYVLEEYRGHHIAKRMIEHAISICRARDFKFIRLHVAPDNLPAVKTYSSLGFVFTGMQNDIHDYEMCLDLNHNNLKKRLLVLGAGNAQLNLICEAKKMNYYVIVCDNRPDMVGSRIANKYYQVNYMDCDSVFEIAQKEGIDGVISNSEPAMPIVAEIAQKLNLRGTSVSSVNTLISKAKFRALQKKMGVFSPAYYVVDDVDTLLLRASEISFPIIIKPTESCGTQGTTRLDVFDEQNIRDAFEICKTFSRNESVTIEQYVEMNNLRVNDVDVFVCGEEFIWDGWLWEDRAVDAPMLPMTEIFPMELSKEKKQKIEDTVKKLLQGADVTFGEYNVETYFTKDDDVFVIEMNPRQAGNYIPQLIEQHTGVNLCRLLVSTAVNDMSYFNELKSFVRTNNFVTLQVVFSKKTGIMESLYIDPEVKKYVQWINQSVLPGEVVKKGRNAFDAVAFVNLQFDTYENQHKYTDEIEKYIYPIVK